MPAFLVIVTKEQILDQWSHHFQLEGALLKSITDIGEVTISILQFNSSERVLERETLKAIGRYPTESARVRMNSGTE